MGGPNTINDQPETSLEKRTPAEIHTMRERLKTNLVSVLGSTKAGKALQSVVPNNTPKKIVVNLYESQKVNEKELPQDIDGVEIEYRQVDPTELL